MIVDHVLRRIELTAAEQAHFVSLLKVRKLLPRQYLVQQGDVCRYESYVCKGFLRSFYMDEKGNDHTLHFAMEDWWISDATSFHLQVPATRNIVALEASVLLQIEKDDLEQLYKDIPAFERFWRLLEDEAIWTGVLRSKGFFWLASRLDVTGLWSQAGSSATCEPTGIWYAALPKDESSPSVIPPITNSPFDR